MERRRFLKAGAAGAAAIVSAGAAGAADAAVAVPKEAPVNGATLAPACGLYCGACGDHAAKTCHGCGCDCGRCAGKGHARACEIAKCAEGRKLAHCGECGDFACTRLVGFCFDPVWRTHLPVIEDLRRRKAIGTDKWLAEQAEYWRDGDRLAARIAMHAECERKWREFQKGRKGK